ncbi:DUF4435 domain-containing protein [Bacillus mycoides]|nr:DUF4435 domain-containing protein [Bacillus mycoides]
MFNVKLPDENNIAKEFCLDNNGLVIIGANGSGKSRLGAWIEKNDSERVHRVSAQRSLVFEDYIPLKSYKQAENLLWYGTDNERQMDKGKGYRWQWGKHTTTMVDDYNTVLSALIAKQHLQNEKYLEECKQRDRESKPHDPVPPTVLDVLYEIWKGIYPHRNIIISDAQVNVKLEDLSYKGVEMSDGERVALYLIAQCLVIPENKIIIIDEPEVHLHRSIMSKLWKAIEKFRSDCLFIYITHDTQFAASHEHAKKIWVKEFDGEKWAWEFVNSDELLPEQCLLDILGNRKSTIFVEGTLESYDTAIYQEIYKDYYIVPCGSSLNVIDYTKAMNSNSQLHHLKAYGIIDRDFKCYEEVAYLKSQNIYVLEIAEVENLFCIEEVLKAINEHFVFDTTERIEKAKKYVIDDRFENQLQQQIAKAVTSQMKYKLTTYDISGRRIEDVKNKIDSLVDYINFDTTSSEISEKFMGILETRNYSEVLKVFNEKGLSTTIGQCFSINNKEYCQLVLRLLRKGNESIIGGMKNYLPNL